MGLMSVGSAGCRLGPTTVSCADAVPPFPASVEVTALVKLFCVPAVEPTTFTAKVQDAPAARVAPDRPTLLEPAAAVMVPPPQLPASPLGDDTVNPDGNGSVKPTPLSEIAALGFDRLKVSDVVPFSDTLLAPKTFAIAGGELGGGGGGLPEPDEPPPQATFEIKPRAIPRDSVVERTFIQDVGTVFRSSFSFLWLRVCIWDFIALRLGPNIHLVIQLFDLVFCFLNLLKEEHFLLRLVFQVKTAVRRSEPVMRLAIQGVRLDGGAQIADRLLRFLLDHQESC